MDKEKIREEFAKIKVATYNGEKTLHKPLLLLLFLGKYARQEPRIIPYKDIEKELVILLTKYGPVTSSYHPEFPFWNLKNDGIWELINDENVQNLKGHVYPSRKVMIDQNVMGGLTKEIFQALKQDPVLLWELVQLLVDTFIPKQHTESILRDVGLGQG